MDRAAIVELLARQPCVISRHQVLGAGGDDSTIRRMVRRREWARVHDGVYVEHTGPLTWEQRAWAAALLHPPAALAGRSALRAHGLAGGADDDVIELIVDRSRRVDDPPGVRTAQSREFASVALPHLSPPRVRVEHAVLTVASRSRTSDGSIALLADAVQQRRTTAARLDDALVAMPRLRGRALMSEVLRDVATGAYSALERRYLVDVERAHGLPPGERQVRSDTGRIAFRDVRYAGQRTLVELDGRLGHERAADRWADLERDLAALAAGELTLRAGWGQVLAPCRLTAGVARMLQLRGWEGAPHACGEGCTVNGRGSRARSA